MVSHGPGDKNCAWHLDSFAYVAGHGNGDGWNSPGLNRTLNQSDGLMADGSGRRQQSNIGVLFLSNSTRNISRYCSLETFRVHVVADKAEEIWG